MLCRTAALDYNSRSLPTRLAYLKFPQELRIDGRLICCRTVLLARRRSVGLLAIATSPSISLFPQSPLSASCGCSQSRRRDTLYNYFQDSFILTINQFSPINVEPSEVYEWRKFQPSTLPSYDEYTGGFNINIRSVDVNQQCYKNG